MKFVYSIITLLFCSLSFWFSSAEVLSSEENKINMSKSTSFIKEDKTEYSSDVELSNVEMEEILIEKIALEKPKQNLDLEIKRKDKEAAKAFKTFLVSDTNFTTYDKKSEYFENEYVYDASQFFTEEMFKNYYNGLNINPEVIQELISFRNMFLLTIESKYGYDSFNFSFHITKFPHQLILEEYSRFVLEKVSENSLSQLGNTFSSIEIDAQQEMGSFYGVEMQPILDIFAQQFLVDNLSASFSLKKSLGEDIKDFEIDKENNIFNYFIREKGYKYGSLTKHIHFNK